MVMEQTCYVADTDEDGRIVCVWTRPKGKRTARVFDPKKHIFDHNAPVDYHGAKPYAI